MDRSVSVVINTYNRATSLRSTLQSLKRLSYSTFEVIVVNGPSSDDTDRVLSEFAGTISVGRCDQVNLSVSRNIGLEMAAGEFVAFIDDDAIPYEYWLNDLVPHFDTSEVAGVGGFVFDHNGFDFQHCYRMMNRAGSGGVDIDREPDEYCYPGSPLTPYMLGTNALFRRDLALEFGGFDEEYEYYLEETDLCTRLLDAGYLLKQRSGGFVYHMRLASDRRNEHRVFVNWFSIIKNQVYYGIKNAIDGLGPEEIVAATRLRLLEIEDSLRARVQAGQISPAEIDRFRRDSPVAIELGAEHAAEPRHLMAPAKAVGKPFLPHPHIGNASRPTLCLTLSHHDVQITPEMREYAESLLEDGTIVHVLVRSASGENRVTYEDGIWIHHLQLLTQDDSAAGWNMRAEAEILRLRRLYKIDRVEALNSLR